jgi:hypothetical protein
MGHHLCRSPNAQDKKRSNDQIATGVAIVVFWPAAFFVGGDGLAAAELANLKGQMTVNQTVQTWEAQRVSLNSSIAALVGYNQIVGRQWDEPSVSGIIRPLAARSSRLTASTRTAWRWLRSYQVPVRRPAASSPLPSRRPRGPTLCGSLRSL